MHSAFRLGLGGSTGSNVSGRHERMALAPHFARASRGRRRRDDEPVMTYRNTSYTPQRRILFLTLLTYLPNEGVPSPLLLAITRFSFSTGRVLLEYLSTLAKFRALACGITPVPTK